jgi:hypothetical protein
VATAIATAAPASRWPSPWPSTRAPPAALAAGASSRPATAGRQPRSSRRSSLRLVARPGQADFQKPRAVFAWCRRGGHRWRCPRLAPLAPAPVAEADPYARQAGGRDDQQRQSVSTYRMLSRRTAIGDARGRRSDRRVGDRRGGQAAALGSRGAGCRGSRDGRFRNPPVWPGGGGDNMCLWGRLGLPTQATESHTGDQQAGAYDQQQRERGLTRRRQLRWQLTGDGRYRRSPRRGLRPSGFALPRSGGRRAGRLGGSAPSLLAGDLRRKPGRRSGRWRGRLRGWRLG